MLLGNGIGQTSKFLDIEEDYSQSLNLLGHVGRIILKFIGRGGRIIVKIVVG